MWRESSTDGFKYCFMVPSNFLIFRRNGCLFASGNTGKTMAALWAADYLMRMGFIRRVLIAAPLSTLERVWADSIFFHLRNRSFAVLHGTAAKRRREFASNKDFYIVNHDGLEIISDVVKHPKKGVASAKLARDDVDLIILDELAVFRNSQTDKWTILKRLVQPQHWVWGLTGTPIPNAPTDAYAQCKLLTPTTVPNYFTTFKNETMRQRTQYKWVPRPEALTIVHKAMQPAVRFTRDESFDLPGELHTTREVALTATQAKHYKEIMEELMTQVEGGEVLAVNEGVKMMKLVQAACGVLYDRDGNHREIDCRPRIKLVEDIIEEAGEKVIVFAPFTGAVHMLHRELSKHWSCEMVYGKVSTPNRNRIFADFQQRPDPHVLIADQGCMSHGLTLTEANTIVWYAPTTSNDEYIQANGRITRQGQRTVANIVHIASTKLEREMYKRLQEKTALQGLLLDMVSQGGVL